MCGAIQYGIYQNLIITDGFRNDEFNAWAEQCRFANGPGQIDRYEFTWDKKIGDDEYSCGSLRNAFTNGLKKRRVRIVEIADLYDLNLRIETISKTCRVSPERV